jgi:hypothetical protein
MVSVGRTVCLSNADLNTLTKGTERSRCPQIQVVLDRPKELETSIGGRLDVPTDHSDSAVEDRPDVESEEIWLLIGRDHPHGRLSFHSV